MTKKFKIGQKIKIISAGFLPFGAKYGGLQVGDIATIEAIDFDIIVLKEDTRSWVARGFASCYIEPTEPPKKLKLKDFLK